MTGKFARTIRGMFAGALLAVTSMGISAVDVQNMGKGDWIWQVDAAITATGTGNVQGLINYEKARGMKWIVVNCGRGGTWYTQFNADLINKAHAAGLMIFGYERCFGDNVPAEAQVGKDCLALGADGFIINAEIEYEGKFAQATQMMNSLRASYPTAFIAHAPFVYIDFHHQFPYVEFGKQCNAVMPQAYWRAAGINKTPAQMVTDMNTQWNKWHTTWISQGNGAAVKPVIPIGDGYNSTSASEIPSFFSSLKSTTSAPNSFGYTGVSFWSAQHHNATHWANIAAGTIGVQDIVVDNNSSGFAASTNWSTGTSAADKYGADYRFRTTAAVSDAAVWNATPTVSGSYRIDAWWSQGSNRSASAPYILPGNVTVNKNQQTNGGKWNTLGTVSLTANVNAQTKLSCWTTTGFVVMADAIRLVKQ